MLHNISRLAAVFVFFFQMAYAQDTLSRIPSSGIKGHHASDYAWAQDLYDEGKYSQAVDLTSKVIARKPEHYEAYLLRGMAREKTGNPEGALVDYDITLHLKPDYTEAKFRRALLLFQMAKYERSITDFVALLQENSTETQAVFFKGQAGEGGSFQTNAITTLQSDMKAEVYNYLAMCYLQQDKFFQALPYLDSAIARSDDPNWLNNRGLLKEKMQDTTGALQDYQRALQRDPGHSHALQNLGALARLAGQDSLLENLVMAAVAEEASASSYFQRGLIMQEKGKYRQAVKDFDQALALDPHQPDYFLQRGFVKEKLKDLTGAMKDYSQALRRDPTLEKAYTNRGNVYFKQKQFEEAVEDYTRAIGLNPENGIIYYNRSMAYRMLKNREAAERDIQQAAALGYPLPADP